MNTHSFCRIFLSFLNHLILCETWLIHSSALSIFWSRTHVIVEGVDRVWWILWFSRTPTWKKWVYIKNVTEHQVPALLSVPRLIPKNTPRNEWPSIPHFAPQTSRIAWIWLCKSPSSANIPSPGELHSTSSHFGTDHLARPSQGSSYPVLKKCQVNTSTLKHLLLFTQR